MMAAKRSAGVTPKVNLRNPLHAGAEVCKQDDPPWLWNLGQTSKNRNISGPTKRTNVLQNFQKNVIIYFEQTLNIKSPAKMSDRYL